MFVDKAEYKTVERLIVVAREGWGNTDFIEHVQNAAEQGIHVIFIGTSGGSVCMNDTLVCHYIERGYIGLTFALRSALLCRRLIRSEIKLHTVIHVRYFKLCAILPIICNGTFFMDIRTSSLKGRLLIRKIENSLMKLESWFFRSTSVISNAVAQLIGLKHFSVLPLGASCELLSVGRRKRLNSNELSFVYIGTFSKRNMEIFVESFRQYIQETKRNWTFTIYGYGSDEEVRRLINAIGDCKQISFRGKISRNLIAEALRISDIGVSFVPITDYFNYQPPTKTYEYLFAGLPVLATATFANREIVNQDNGWIFADTPIGVRAVLSAVAETYKLKRVDRADLERFSWGSIFERDYLPFIRQ